MTSQFIAAVPATAMTFVVMDQTKGMLKNNFNDMDECMMSLYGGAMAGGARLSILVPLDLIKTRA